YEVGLVNRLAEPGAHLEEAMKLARRLAANAPLVMAMLKRFAAATVPQSPVETAGLAWRETERVFRSADYQEGLASFRDKRDPRFAGRGGLCLHSSGHLEPIPPATGIRDARRRARQPMRS